MLAGRTEKAGSRSYLNCLQDNSRYERSRTRCRDMWKFSTNSSIPRAGGSLGWRSWLYPLLYKDDIALDVEKCNCFSSSLIIRSVTPEVSRKKTIHRPRCPLQPLMLAPIVSRQ